MSTWKKRKADEDKDQLSSKSPSKSKFFDNHKKIIHIF